MTSQRISDPASPARAATVLASLLWLVLVGLPSPVDPRLPAPATVGIALAVLAGKHEVVAAPPLPRAIPRAPQMSAAAHAPAHLQRRCAGQPRAPDLA